MKHVARKRFGQHFLVDDSVVDAIVRRLDPQPGEAIVEIGPGLGALTWPVLERCGAVTVIELDRDLAARLRQHERGLGVIEADVLKVDFPALAARFGQPLRVVGNLPYNISSPILFHLMQAAGCIRDQHLMLQKEVAERIVAGPGRKDYGRLSVMMQWRYSAEISLVVAPHAFDPPPKVWSAVVSMRPRAEPTTVSPTLLGEIVATAFSQRRKLLRHTLGRWLEARGATGGFDLQRRAEQVPVEEYVALARRLSAA